VQLTVLGCSGTFPGPDSPCSGYLVEHEGYRLVVDLGAGALGQLQRHCDLLDVDAVYLSFPPRLPVYGPAGTRERIRGCFEQPPDRALLDVFDFHDHPGGVAQLGPLTLTSAVVNHPVECHALRLEAAGRVLAYSGDTAESAALVELARGADTFLCEASWASVPEPPAGIHLTGRAAGEHAARAGAKRLLLTHLTPYTDPSSILAEAAQTYAGELELARCGATYDV